jgi:hypothetical protein
MSHTHIERPNQSDDDVVCEMLCGAQCLIFPDGTIIPADFDFYVFKFGHKASCPRCRELHGEQSSATIVRRELVDA